MEVWKDIAGYEGIYQVSDAGRVRSVDRVNARGWKLKGKIRSISISDAGYAIVTLCKDSSRQHCRVHRLVAEAFIPNPENKPEVNHIDGNKADNRVEKLEWCTADENCGHAARSGLLKTKLNEDEVREIRWLRGLGASLKDIAREYQLSVPSVRSVVLRESWSHV